MEVVFAPARKSARTAHLRQRHLGPRRRRRPHQKAQHQMAAGMNARQYKLKVFADLGVLSGEAAARTAARIRAAAAQGRPFSLVLAGGSTPQSLYEILARE